MRIVFDTDSIKSKITNLWYRLNVDIKTRLHIRNKGFYMQIMESNFDGCPRCKSKRIKFVKDTSNAIVAGHVNECQVCGQRFDIYIDYDKR